MASKRHVIVKLVLAALAVGLVVAGAVLFAAPHYSEGSHNALLALTERDSPSSSPSSSSSTVALQQPPSRWVLVKNLVSQRPLVTAAVCVLTLAVIVAAITVAVLFAVPGPIPSPEPTVVEVDEPISGPSPIAVEQDEDHGLGGGEIFGIVLGCLALLSLLVYGAKHLQESTGFTLPPSCFRGASYISKTCAGFCDPRKKTYDIADLEGVKVTELTSPPQMQVQTKVEGNDTYFFFGYKSDPAIEYMELRPRDKGLEHYFVGSQTAALDKVSHLDLFDMSNPSIDRGMVVAINWFYARGDHEFDVLVARPSADHFENIGTYKLLESGASMQQEGNWTKSFPVAEPSDASEYDPSDEY